MEEEELIEKLEEAIEHIELIKFNCNKQLDDVTDRIRKIRFWIKYPKYIEED